MQNAIQPAQLALTLTVLAAYIFAILDQLVVQLVPWSVDQFNAQFARRFQRLNITCQELAV